MMAKPSDVEPELAEERILVLAPTHKDAVMCQEILGREGFPCTICADLPQVCRQLQAGAAVLLLTEELLVPDQGDGLSQALADQPAWSDLPILVLTRGGVESSSARFAVRHLDNVMLLERPIQALTLVSAVRMAVKARHRQYQMRDYLVEQQQQREALQESETRLRATFENAASGIMQTDDQGRFVAVNNRFRQMLGYVREELLGMSVHDLTYPDDRPRSDDLNAHFARGDCRRFNTRHVTWSAMARRCGSTWRCPLFGMTPAGISTRSPLPWTSASARRPRRPWRNGTGGNFWRDPPAGLAGRCLMGWPWWLPPWRRCFAMRSTQSWGTLHSTKHSSFP